MNKKAILGIFLILMILLIVLAVWKVITALKTDGYLFVGDAWQSTPEKALARAADQTIEDRNRFTIVHLLEKQSIDDLVEMTFISEGDTLVTVTFVTNDKGQYALYGSTEEVDLGSPTEFLLNGDPDQDILFPYNQYSTKVTGWCCTHASFTVNGKTPSRKTYRFESQGQEWSIDYWWVDGITKDTDVKLEYNVHESAN